MDEYLEMDENEVGEMDEATVTDLLIQMLWDVSSGAGALVEDYPEFEDADAYDFDAAGIMTNNTGIVLTMPTGERFQLTVKRAN